MTDFSEAYINEKYILFLFENYLLVEMIILFSSITTVKILFIYKAGSSYCSDYF